MSDSDDEDGLLSAAVSEPARRRPGGTTAKALAAQRAPALREAVAEIERARHARRAFLAAQGSEFFAHFTGAGAGAGAGSGSAAAGAGSSRKRGRKAGGGGGGDGDDGGGGGGDGDGSDAVDRLTTQPSCVTGAMRDYQVEGLNWMIGLHHHGVNGILADEMGLGKTLQTISMLGYCQQYLGWEGPHLILVPKSTLSNWQREVAKWCPSLSTLVLHGEKPVRAELIRRHIRPFLVTGSGVRRGGGGTARGGRASAAATTAAATDDDDEEGEEEDGSEAADEDGDGSGGEEEEGDGGEVEAAPPAEPDTVRGWHVLITTYEVACIEQATLSRMAWQYLVIDEAQRIKNENARLSLVIRSFLSTHRLLITGTPLQNNLHELWALLNFLLPDEFESSADFDTWFNLSADGKDEEAKASMVRQLHKVLRPFMLRRLKAEVAKSLPPKTETVLYVGLTRMQRDLYRSILLRNIDSVLVERGGDKTRMANLLMHLRKACNHPYLFDGMEDRSLDPLGEHLITNCAKLQLLDKLLPKLKAMGSRCLIFSQMTRVLDILEDYCAIRGYTFCRIDGDTSYDEREAAIDYYNASGSDRFLFLLSTRAGGLGINLATADVVILYDSDWNPQVDLQAQDRAHRIGQTKPVKVYRLVTQGSVEEKIVERAWMKLKLDAVVVQQGRLGDKVKTLSKEELQAMVTFGADAVFKSSTTDNPNAIVSDADIDQILELGSKKTKALNEAIAAKVGGSEGGLLDFKIDSYSSQQFEGVDYSTAAKRKQEAEQARALRLAIAQASAEAMAMTSRIGAGRNPFAYDELEVHRALAALEGGGSKGKQMEAAKMRGLLPPDHRPPPRMDAWMFINAARVREICAMEIAHIISEKDKKRDAAAKPKAAAGDGAGVAGEGGSVGSAGAVVAAGGAAASGDDGGEYKPTEFPAELIAERAALCAEGFPTWKREDFDAFVRACTQHGRWNIAAITADLVAHGKATCEEEMTRYAMAFWSLGPKPEYFGPVAFKRMHTRIERGEMRLRELAAANLLLTHHLARFDGGHDIAALVAAGHALAASVGAGPISPSHAGAATASSTSVAAAGGGSTAATASLLQWHPGRPNVVTLPPLYVGDPYATSLTSMLPNSASMFHLQHSKETGWPSQSLLPASAAATWSDVNESWLMTAAMHDLVTNHQPHAFATPAPGASAATEDDEDMIAGWLREAVDGGSGAAAPAAPERYELPLLQPPPPLEVEDDAVGGGNMMEHADFDLLRRQVLSHEGFRFDYFMRSRQPPELRERMLRTLKQADRLGKEVAARQERLARDLGADEARTRHALYTSLIKARDKADSTVRESEAAVAHATARAQQMRRDYDALVEAAGGAVAAAAATTTTVAGVKRAAPTAAAAVGSAAKRARPAGEGAGGADDVIIESEASSDTEALSTDVEGDGDAGAGAAAGSASDAARKTAPAAGLGSLGGLKAGPGTAQLARPKAPAAAASGAAGAGAKVDRGVLFNASAMGNLAGQLRLLPDVLEEVYLTTMGRELQAAKSVLTASLARFGASPKDAAAVLQTCCTAKSDAGSTRWAMRPEFSEVLRAAGKVPLIPAGPTAPGIAVPVTLPRPPPAAAGRATELQQRIVEAQVQSKAVTAMLGALHGAGMAAVAARTPVAAAVPAPAPVPAAAAPAPAPAASGSGEGSG